MQTFGAFFVSVLAASFAVAAPTADQAFTIPIIHNENHTPNGVLALAKAYNKYGTALPKDLADAYERVLKGKLIFGRDQGSVIASPQPEGYDLEYLAEVNIGTPAQKLYLNFDTGSSDLWVFSNETPRNQVNGHPIYDSGKSSSAKKLNNYSWSIRYADQSSCSGDVFTDKVTIGGLTVSNQAVEPAQKVSAQFTNSPQKGSGLLGLAFDKINTVSPQKQKTWFSNIKSRLNKRVFTANLKHQSDGTYNFGFIDDSEHTGPIIYTPVDNSKGYWGFTSTGYQVGDGSFVNTQINGISDTGTSLILIAREASDAYWAQVSSARYDSNIAAISYDCSETIPDFYFGVEGSKIKVPASLINYGYADNTGQRCFGGIQSSGNLGDLSIFGDVALKAALCVYDEANMQVGWAQK